MKSFDLPRNHTKILPVH